MDNPIQAMSKRIQDAFQERVAKRRDMARKMQRNLAADVVDLESAGVTMAEDAVEEAKEAAKDKEADPLANVTGKTLRTIGGDKQFFKLVTAADLERHTKSRLRRESQAQRGAHAQVRERAAAIKSSKLAAAQAAQAQAQLLEMGAAQTAL
jgi:hypothetical protein